MTLRQKIEVWITKKKLQKSRQDTKKALKESITKGDRIHYNDLRAFYVIVKHNIEKGTYDEFAKNVTLTLVPNDIDEFAFYMNIMSADVKFHIETRGLGKHSASFQDAASPIDDGFIEEHIIEVSVDRKLSPRQNERRTVSASYTFKNEISYNGLTGSIKTPKKEEAVDRLIKLLQFGFGSVIEENIDW